jgi:hypothetical protein
MKRDLLELEDAARFMVYEYVMFNASCFLLANYTGDSQVIRNLALEGALLHARNLADFLRANESHRDDINAGHFVEDPLGDASDVLDTERTRLNKRLMHPSYQRASMPERWDVQGIHNGITRGWKGFLGRLEKQHPDRAEWFGSAASILMNMSAAEWDPQWREAESSLEWWEPKDLSFELAEVLRRLEGDGLESWDEGASIV